MSYIPRRGGGAGKPTRRQYVNMDENYIHDTVMFLVNILEAQDDYSMKLNKLTVEFCKRGNTKPLKKVAIGDSFEDRILTFCWQHPTIFKTTLHDGVRTIHLRPIQPDIDDELEKNIEERLIEFLVFRCNQYGPCQIPISKLMGNLYQAACDIRNQYSDYLRFYNFLRARRDIFTLINSETVALKTAFDQAIKKNTSLLKCDEYYLDDRVLNCTQMIDNFEEGHEIVKSILNTKELIAIDCEGVNLGAPNGYITLVQLAIVDDLPDKPSDDDIVKAIKIYLFDVQEDDRLMYISLKKLLKSPKITKIFQGCSSDATALYNRYKIVTNSVFDTVIAHRHLYEGTKSDLYYLYEFYTGEGTNRMKKDIKKKYISNPKLWTTRPLNELLTYYAAFDVFALIRIYYKLKDRIDQKTYDDIHDKSSTTAQSAYRRSLPLLGIQLYAKGYTMEQVHKEIGWPMDSDDEYYEEMELSSNNNKTRRFPPANDKPHNHQQTDKYHKNYRNHDEYGNEGGGSTSNHRTNHYSNSTKYYNGHFPQRSTYNQSYRPNSFTQSDFPTRSRVPAYHHHQQAPTNHFDNTQQLQLAQQRNFYDYNGFRYNQPYQYQQHYHFPRHQFPHAYQQNQFHQQSNDQKVTQQVQHQQNQQHHHHQQPHHQQHQQKQNYQNRHQHHNGKRNVQN